MELKERTEYEVNRFNSILLFVVFINLVSCQDGGTLTLDSKEVVKVEVSKSEGFDKVNPNFFTLYDDQETLQIFIDAIDHAEQVEGIVDMAEPELDINISFKDSSTKGYHIWLSGTKDNATLMEVDNTHTIYTVTPESTQQLRALLQKNLSIQLNFHPIHIKEIKQGTPKKGWIQVKTIEIGKLDAGRVLVHFYVESDNENSVYAFVEHVGKLYELGDVAYSYGLDDVLVQRVNQSFNDGEKNINIIAGLGTAFTYWDILAFDQKNGRWLTFEVMGRPEMVDLDHDGRKELVAIFEGAHLNYPDVAIARLNKGMLELSEIAEQIGKSDKQYVRITKEDGSFVFETGKVNEDQPQHYFRYENGQLTPLGKR
jgi:hypothetical protein